MHSLRSHYNIRSQDGLIIFAKAPQICRVKTRMLAQFNHRQCLYLYRHLLHDTYQQAHSRRYRVTLYTAGPGMSGTQKQRGYDLGQRMLHALQAQLKTHQRVVLIGADSLVTSAIIEQAFAHLDKPNAVVIGPANDGGYMLIGAHTRIPQELFCAMQWGHAGVLSTTLTRLNRCGLQTRLLAPVIDLDTPADWQQMLARQSRPSWTQCLLKCV